MFALVDCNNFYASCERVFRPDLKGKPIVVLSNNDGCVIARSNEIKKLGIKMGVPAFQIKDEIRKYDIQVFSSNYTLYGDMSNRVMSLLSAYSPDMEIYSIDEAFLNLKGFSNLQEYGLKIVSETSKGTGIPLSMGIAATKTLAKVANKFAKKYPGYKGCCTIDTEEKRIKALQKTDIADVWGIGHRFAKKLRLKNVNNAYEFTLLPQKWVRQEMTVVGERMYRELLGESCIDMELQAPPKKQICTSRAFGEMQTDIEGLREAVSSFAALCAQKLREQNSCAVALMVFIHTNNFREDLPQYFKNCVIELPVPTNSTFEIVHHALDGLSKIYKDGFRYKKAGVIITEIVPDNAIQLNLFESVNHEKHSKIMKIMDKLNSGFNRNALQLAVQSNKRGWKLRREQLSPCYSTRMSDIITVNCG